jgi:4-aminobutyrate aminotransferase
LTQPLKQKGIPPGPEALKLVERESKVFSPSFDRLYPLFSKEVVGSTIRDVDGFEYIDLSAGSGSQPLGGSNPELVSLIAEKSKQMGHISFPYLNESTIDLSEKLAAITPGSYQKRVCYGTSGAEAMEGAFKLARYHTKRQLCISFFGAHSGHETMGSLSLCGHYAGQRAGFHPVVPGVIHAPYAYCYRCTYKLKYPECDLWCARVIEEDIFTTIAPPEDIAAIFVEPMQGPGGMIVPPPDYHKALKKMCEKYRILYIADEVVTGLGRTGKMWATEHYGVEPDIIVTGKGLGGGIFPISAFVAKSEVMSWPAGVHSATYPAHPLGCAISSKVIEIIERDHLVERAARLGEYMLRRCNELMEKHELVGDVRGKGLFAGIELVKNRKTKIPATKEIALVAHRAFEKGLAIQFNGLKFNVIKLYPPLNIEEKELDRGLDILDESIGDVEKGLVTLPQLPPEYLTTTGYR